MCRVLAVGALTVMLLSAVAAAQESEIKPIKPALLVIDIQNKYIPMMDEGEQESALRMINAFIWKFRQFNLPVIRVYHTDPKWGPEPGSADFEFPESVLVEENDPKIVKNHPSAFTKTELDALLGERDVNTVFLCGLSATGCVLATYFGAMDREYDVFLLESAILSPDAEHTETIKDILESVSWRGLDAIFRGVAR